MKNICLNCKHYVATRKGEGLCTYTCIFVAHVRAIDYCDCFENAYKKEQQ